MLPQRGMYLQSDFHAGACMLRAVYIHTSKILLPGNSRALPDCFTTSLPPPHTRTMKVQSSSACRNHCCPHRGNLCGASHLAVLCNMLHCARLPQESNQLDIITCPRGHMIHNTYIEPQLPGLRNKQRQGSEEMHSQRNERTATSENGV